jgi:hypothetical protein
MLDEFDADEVPDPETRNLQLCVHNKPLIRQTQELHFLRGLQPQFKARQLFYEN